jgi:cholesterol transport system auxiliary component
VNQRKALRRGALLLALLGVGGCQGLSRPAPQPSEFDLGPPSPVPAATPAFALRDVVVVAPSWLASQAMQYRLLYDQPAQRRSYADSRWVAPPAELLETALRRAVVSSETALSGAGCKLRIDLDELIQAFPSAAESNAVIEARGSLLAPRTDRLLARKRFSLMRPAPAADARGGVAATAAATQALSAELRDWLRHIDREGSLAQRCAGA